MTDQPEKKTPMAKDTDSEFKLTPAGPDDPIFKMGLVISSVPAFTRPTVQQPKKAKGEVKVQGKCDPDKT